MSNRRPESEPGGLVAQTAGGGDERFARRRDLHLAIGSLRARKILARGLIFSQCYAMPELIRAPIRVAAAGTKPKIIEEYFGRVNSGDERLSIAHMRSPSGWGEPGQTPEFGEYTVVLRGQLRVTHRGGALDVQAGQAILARAGEWVQYSTPGEEGAEYIAVCRPAFSPQTVHRDE